MYATHAAIDNIIFAPFMYAFVIIAVLALAGKKPAASAPTPAPTSAPAPTPAPTTSAIVVAPASTPVATIPIAPEPTAIVIAPKQTIATLITEAVQAPARPQLTQMDSKTLACIFVDREEPVKLSTPVNTNKKGGKTKRNKRSIKNLIAEQVLA